MATKTKEPKGRRYTKTIAFSAEEYDAIRKEARKMGLYPRQAIIIKMGVTL